MAADLVSNEELLTSDKLNHLFEIILTNLKKLLF